ncbi:unnamed protein product, partial [marine sediment metagenome]
DEFKALAKEELKHLLSQADALLEQIKNTVVMADDMSIASVIMEIRAGTGGEEAALFARDLYNMYVKYADSRKWKIEQLDFSTTEKGGFREVIFNVKGPGVWSKLGYEAGGHRVQRVPQTESQGRIHTSAATVAVLGDIVANRNKIRDINLVVDVVIGERIEGQKVTTTRGSHDDVAVTHTDAFNKRRRYRGRRQLRRLIR